jgi:branched-chain amino acid transport system permease protein
VQIDGLFDEPGIQVGEVFMDSQYLSIIVIATLLVLLQYLIFEKTLLGKKLQATSQDKEMASLLGIPVVLMVMITFAYSSAMGGLAGMLVAPILFVSVNMAGIITLKAFAANIIGGYGSIPGAILGGLALGVVETMGAAYISVPYKDALAFAVLLLFLMVRPQGLFGEKISEKA